MDVRSVVQAQSDSQLNSGIRGSGAEEAIDILAGDEHLKMIRNLRLEVEDKNCECEMLKIRLDESSRDLESLSQELNQCKLTMFEHNEMSKKIHEEVLKSKKLEEDYVKLMDDFAGLSDQNTVFRQNLFDSYLAKTNAINNLECLMSSGAIAHQLNECKLDLDNKMAELNLALAKMRNLEEDNFNKDKTISELRMALEEAKVKHKREVSELEEFIQSLKDTIGSFEKSLTNFVQQRPQGQ